MYVKKCRRISRAAQAPKHTPELDRPLGHIIVSLMKSTTIRELKHQTAKVLGWTEGGESVAVTRRGKRVAVLVPPTSKRTKRPDFAARLETIYGRKKLKQTGTDLVRAARGER